MPGMLTIRNIPDDAKTWLRGEADRTASSMEAIVRRLITDAYERTAPPKEKPSEIARRLFGPENGFELVRPRVSFEPRDIGKANEAP